MDYLKLWKLTKLCFVVKCLRDFATERSWVRIPVPESYTKISLKEINQFSQMGNTKLKINIFLNYEKNDESSDITGITGRRTFEKGR